MTTPTRQAIAAALTVIEQLDVCEELGSRNTELGEASPSGTDQVNDSLIPNSESRIPDSTIAVLHLGHPSSPKYGTVEYMTFEQYERFRWMNTWPRPKKV